MTREEALRKAWPLGVATYPLCRIEDTVKLATTCRQYWFRGHPQEFPWLLPAAYRKPFFRARKNIEFRAGQRFRLRARSFVSKVPEWGDYLSWLFLMQHYGVPTRLLDWTESILVALYFATEQNDKPGEVWCMNPNRLNWHGKRHLCSPDDPPIKYLAGQVFLEAKEHPGLCATLGLEEAPRTPLALIPPFQFPRMAAQLSRFTIHPSADEKAMIEFLLRSETCLVRYSVPAAKKVGLRKDPAALGVSHDTLYHSLESLAETIKEEILEKDYDLKSPPKFKRE
jgi:hypothetical protein